MLVPLRALIELQDRSNLNNSVTNILSSFSCTQDKDIEFFLHHRAVEFEKISKSRTYLLCDIKQNALTISIFAYFTLSIKTLQLPQDMSINRRKKLDGLSGKIHNEPINDIPCFLIGQLGKNSNFDKSVISGYEILRQALAVINYASLSIGGRWILIECRDNPKLIDFYTSNGFQLFMRQPDNNKPMVQMLRKIDNVQ